MKQEPFTVAYGGLPLEGESRDGELTWQTLICADRTPSGSLVVGVADFPPGGHLKFHRHEPAEFYFCLAGSATVQRSAGSCETTPVVCLGSKLLSVNLQFPTKRPTRQVVFDRA